MPDNVAWLLWTVDLAAVVVFAVSGALTASRKQMDIVGFIWLGALTGIGGGSVRDALLGRPVFWVEDPSNILACILAGAAVFFTAHLVESRYRLLLWLDAAGVALVCVAGAAKALDSGAGWLVAVAMGAITATVGGVIRDMVAGEPSVIMRREIYVSASLLGGGVFVALDALTGAQAVAASIAAAAAFSLRAAAFTFGWELPRYRPRRGRSMAEIARLKGP